MESPSPARPVQPAPTLLGTKRPHPRLMTYYVLTSLLAFIGFPVLLCIRYLRYRSLRYQFDDEGVSMSWGVLNKREVSLAYGRIQDIHLESNLVERRLGLARVLVQTASGSSKAEMTIEGLPEYNAIRDLLYTRMRDARGLQAATDTTDPANQDNLAGLLGDIAAELRAVRQQLEERPREDPS